MKQTQTSDDSKEHALWSRIWTCQTGSLTHVWYDHESLTLISHVM